MHQSIPTPSPLATSHQGAAQRPGGDASRGPSLGQLPLGEGSGTGVVGRSVGFLMGRLGGWGGIEVNIAGALIPGWSITPRLPPLLLLSLPSLHTHTTQVLEQLPSLLPSLLDSLSAGSEAVVVAALGVRTAHSCIPMTGKSMAYWKAQDLRPKCCDAIPKPFACPNPGPCCYRGLSRSVSAGAGVTAGPIPGGDGDPAIAGGGDKIALKIIGHCATKNHAW